MQYQYAGNPHLVYAVVRRRPCFEKLAALTLPQARAQAELAHARALKTRGPTEADVETDDGDLAALAVREALAWCFVVSSGV